MNIGTMLLTCALLLSAIAAYYSIVGLAAIFSAAFWPVVIMATVLEISKLVVASWLYRNWETTAPALKAYLTASVLILMGITSLGIFGFLSKAHVEQGVGTTQINLRVEQLDSQAQNHKTTIQRYEAQLAQLDRAINQQLDQNRTTQALNFRRQQETERTQIRVKLDAEQNALQTILKERGELKSQTAVLDSKLGALKYVAELFLEPSEVDVEKTVRWMILALVIVFDPLAVLMLIAANMNRKPVAVSNVSPVQAVVHEASPTPALVAAPKAETMQTASKMSSNAIKISKREQPNMTWYNSDGTLVIPTSTGWKTFERVVPKFITPTPDVSRPSPEPQKSVTHHTQHTQTIVQKQEIDLRELSSAVEATLNTWLSSNLSVARPLDPTVIKDMIEQVVFEQTSNEQPIPETPAPETATTPKTGDEHLRPYHPKMLAKEYRKSLKQP